MSPPDRFTYRLVVLRPVASHNDLICEHDPENIKDIVLHYKTLSRIITGGKWLILKLLNDDKITCAWILENKKDKGFTKQSSQIIHELQRRETARQWKHLEVGHWK